MDGQDGQGHSSDKREFGLPYCANHAIGRISSLISHIEEIQIELAICFF